MAKEEEELEESVKDLAVKKSKEFEGLELS